ncbi:putative uncharacterized protein [Aliivibrio wodanis]|uniref:Uncharacterized protein n=1 Tax=Aliivibrio wodanis TaxID=80852 RepID=A0A090K019_9GAMM|nr:putative uncharacterized protein [Aliivibrio wodanis]
MESNIHNYMEVLVGKRFIELDFHQIYTLDQITDMKCIALNQLPTLYIRYSLDMLAGTPQKKIIQYNNMVAAAVENAEKWSLMIEDNVMMILKILLYTCLKTVLN